MGLKNSPTAYGWISIAFHWLSALVVLGLFALGLWMVDLDYYDVWYRTAPHWHKSVGVLFVFALVLRLGWRLYTPPPQAPDTHKRWEKLISKLVHGLLYLMLIAMLPTGYLITTAKGQGLEVFDWFVIPSLVSGVDNLEYTALEIHELLAYSIIGIASLHALAALKHHFLDKDVTLLRMLGKSSSKQGSYKQNN